MLKARLDLPGGVGPGLVGSRGWSNRYPRIDQIDTPRMLKGGCGGWSWACGLVDRWGDQRLLEWHCRENQTCGGELALSFDCSSAQQAPTIQCVMLVFHYASGKMTLREGGNVDISLCVESRSHPKTVPQGAHCPPSRGTWKTIPPVTPLLIFLRFCVGKLGKRYPQSSRHPKRWNTIGGVPKYDMSLLADTREKEMGHIYIYITYF